jgi:RHS repeat-associated protein
LGYSEVPYVNDLVLRDDDFGDGPTRVTYAQHDANYDVTSIADDSGDVLERFTYSPYGVFTVLSNTWSSEIDGYSWIYFYQGGRWDTYSGTYYFGNRDYDPITGTWREEDPLGTMLLRQQEKIGTDASILAFSHGKSVDPGDANWNWSDASIMGQEDESNDYEFYAMVDKVDPSGLGAVWGLNNGRGAQDRGVNGWNFSFDLETTFGVGGSFSIGTSE